jgi:hypothetical protein
MARFRLTRIAPTEHGVHTFDHDVDIWTETDVAKTLSDRYALDSSRDSVMRIKGLAWTLGDGCDLGDGLYLDDSLVGIDEGAYYDFVSTPEVLYSFACFYKIALGTLELIFWDQTNDEEIETIILDDLDSWFSYECNITAPFRCVLIRVTFSQPSVHSSPFYIDNVSFNANVVLSDPDVYNRVPQRIGAFQQTLSGRRVYDLRAIHYAFELMWNYCDSLQYENFRVLLYSNELLYFDDGDVPPLTELDTVYDNDVYDYTGITNPSSTHKAYVSSSNLLPVAIGDFQTTEYSTANYQAIDDDDVNYKQTLGVTSGYYLYHKYLIKSSIIQADVQRFLVRVKAESDDTSLNNLDGCVLYAWDGTGWTELVRTTNNGLNYLEYTTAEQMIASKFVDVDDDYVRIILRSVGTYDGANALDLTVYFVEIEINEDLDNVIDLTHKAILDNATGDVISVKNLTTGLTLTLDTDYTIAVDRRSIITTGQTTGDIIEVVYNRYFEVLFSEIPEEWMGGDQATEITRKITITLKTLSESK